MLFTTALLKSKHLEPPESWECLKCNIIADSQQYCYERAANRKLVPSQLEGALQKLEQNISDNPSEPDLKLYERTKADYNEIIDEKALGAKFRSGQKFYTEGELPTKYFLNLEKNRSGAKGMSSMLLNSGEIITDGQTIIKEQHRSYRKLYSKDENVKFNYVNEVGLVLPPDLKNSLEWEIQMHELKTAVKSLKRNKSPGCDGLTSEYYVMFFDRIKHYLLEAINALY